MLKSTILAKMMWEIVCMPTPNMSKMTPISASCGASLASATCCRPDGFQRIRYYGFLGTDTENRSWHTAEGGFADSSCGPFHYSY